jgi:hypothetical protein
MKAKVQVRSAVPKDIPVIHDFISQLAVFEKCPERVLATYETLTKTLGLQSEPAPTETDITATHFRPGQFAKCVLAEVDGKEAGIAVFFYNYSTVLIPHPSFFVVTFLSIFAPHRLRYIFEDANCVA